MKHRKKIYRLGRTADVRHALLRNLAESLIIHGSIKTTAAKAKAVRVFIEPLVTKARKQSLTTERLIRQSLYSDAAVKKMCQELGPKYVNRPGGYTRTIKLAPRGADAAAMVRIEFV